jgi:2,3-bisphosphoglycerate-independent phosphoglycerate mutase
MNLNILKSLIRPADSRILLLVIDGLGGLPMNAGGPSELEKARTPNLDELASEGICGLHQPVTAGITPGSGPGHLALFGYDPLEYQIGRGVLAALGVDFELRPGDVAARGNFCTVDDQGVVTDRRAGRISTEKNRELCALLRGADLDGVELFVETVKEHRFLFVLRAGGLSAAVSDTDPQVTGIAPKQARALGAGAEKTASLVHRFVEHAGKTLSDSHPANMVLLRGFASLPKWPQLPEVIGMRAAAAATYPMYRGVAKLVGMEVLEAGNDLDSRLDALRGSWDEHEYFFLHVKKPDSAGEDGDFDRKVAEIEAVDARIPELRRLGPDVLIVTGDHSTPAKLRYHSWHPVPAVLWSARCRPDPVSRFNERDCLAGALGPAFPAVDLLPLALANAGRLEKFGA